jgi:hypothetical protein
MIKSSSIASIIWLFSCTISTHHISFSSSFCSFVKSLLTLDNLETSVDNKSPSVLHIFMYFSTSLKEIIGFLSRGFVSVLSLSITQTASTMIKCVFVKVLSFSLVT